MKIEKWLSDFLVAAFRPDRQIYISREGISAIEASYSALNRSNVKVSLGSVDLKFDSSNHYSLSSVVAKMIFQGQLLIDQQTPEVRDKLVEFQIKSLMSILKIVYEENYKDNKIEALALNTFWDYVADVIEEAIINYDREKLLHENADTLLRHFYIDNMHHLSVRHLEKAIRWMNSVFKNNMQGRLYFTGIIDDISRRYPAIDCFEKNLSNVSALIYDKFNRQTSPKWSYQVVIAIGLLLILPFIIVATSIAAIVSTVLVSLWMMGFAFYLSPQRKFQQTFIKECISKLDRSRHFLESIQSVSREIKVDEETIKKILELCGAVARFYRLHPNADLSAAFRRGTEAIPIMMVLYFDIETKKRNEERHLKRCEINIVDEKVQKNIEVYSFSVIDLANYRPAQLRKKKIEKESVTTSSKPPVTAATPKVAPIITMPAAPPGVMNAVVRGNKSTDQNTMAYFLFPPDKERDTKIVEDIQHGDYSFVSAKREAGFKFISKKNSMMEEGE